MQRFRSRSNALLTYAVSWQWILIYSVRDCSPLSAVLWTQLYTETHFTLTAFSRLNLLYGPSTKLFMRRAKREKSFDSLLRQIIWKAALLYRANYVLLSWNLSLAHLQTHYPWDLIFITSTVNKLYLNFYLELLIIFSVSNSNINTNA